jgi:hypothetical protein
VQQQGSPDAGTRLGQHLRRQHPERETGIDDVVRQPVGGESTALDDRLEADLLGVAHAIGELGEGLAVVEVRGVNEVSRSAELIGERPDATVRPRAWWNRINSVISALYSTTTER